NPRPARRRPYADRGCSSASFSWLGTGMTSRTRERSGEHDDRLLAWERRSDWPLTVLALLYLVAYGLPIVVVDLPGVLGRTCSVPLTLVWAAFVVDYVARLALSRRRWQFVRRHVLDALAVALPVLRPLRLLRLISVLRILNRRATAGFVGRVATYVVGSASM